MGFYEEQVYAQEVNNRDELLMRINNVADIIRHTPNLFEKSLRSLHDRLEKCNEVNQNSHRTTFEDKNKFSSVFGYDYFAM